METKFYVVTTTGRKAVEYEMNDDGILEYCMRDRKDNIVIQKNLDLELGDSISCEVAKDIIEEFQDESSWKIYGFILPDHLLASFQVRFLAYETYYDPNL